MNIIRNSGPTPSGLPGIDHETLAGSNAGLRSLCLWRQSLGPGAATPPHRHHCEEVVVCLSGEGELHIDGRVERFGRDCTVVLPADVDHQLVNIGATPLEMIAVFGTAPVVAYFPDGAEIPLPWQS